MNIPFLRFFKRDKADEGSVAVAPQPVASIEKPSAERLGKTFIPNSSRIVRLEPIANFSAPSAGSSPAQTAPAPPRKISLGGQGAIAVGPKDPASVTAAERTIALSLGDLVPNLPRELLKPSQLDHERQVLLKAAEVERGMATGRPSVLLRAIYNAVPEFFINEVPSTDLREVALPFKKVVDQFAGFQVRDDQVADQEYPQLETPFLQVTLEDNERFGKQGTLPAAGKIAAGKPEAVADAKPKGVAATPPAVQAATPVVADTAPKPKDPIRFSMPAPVSAPVAAPTAKAPPVLDQAPKVAAAVPIPAALAPKPSAPLPPSVPAAAGAPVAAPAAKAPPPLGQSLPSPPTTAEISPNGTGAPAAERVPASSGPPVPTPLPSPFAPLPPTRIPFKVDPPSGDLREPSKLPTVRANPDAVDLASSGPRISLPLRNILRDVAPFQLSGPIEAVPDTARIEIPFSIVQSQLALGRVAISPAQFLAALPEEYRALFKADPAETPVPLSLEDVLQNLPSESLQLRGDQEEPEVAEAFETPFSQKASEDAARMKVSAGPISKTTAATTATALKPVAATTQPAVKRGVAAAEPAAQLAPASAETATKAVVPLPKKASVESAKVAPVEPAKKSSKKVKVAPATKPATDTKAAAPSTSAALQKVLETDEPLDAKSVVGHVSRLPGVSACAIVFSDGLSLAGNIPEEYEADALCAMAPLILKRIDEQMLGAKFGALSCLTLYCAKMPVSLFASGNICLAAIHSGGEIAVEVRDRLGRTTQELARMYAQ